MQIEIKKGDIMVANWGYTMMLTTWVKVIKVSPKTLLVQEIVSRGATQEELDEKNLKPGYLQMYSLPTEKFALHNGEPKAQFRLYHPTESERWQGDEKVKIEYWHGYPEDMSIRLSFAKWSGEPQFEDHCD